MDLSDLIEHSGPVLAVVCIEYAFETRHLLRKAGR